MSHLSAAPITAREAIRPISIKREVWHPRRCHSQTVHSRVKTTIEYVQIVRAPSCSLRPMLSRWSVIVWRLKRSNYHTSSHYGIFYAHLCLGASNSAIYGCVT